VRCARGDMNQVIIRKSFEDFRFEGPISRAISHEILRGSLDTAAIVASLLAGYRAVLERPEVTSDIGVTLHITETLLQLSKHISV
jgi:hypothetical protein